MADVAASRAGDSSEKPEIVAAERVDEGRWEGEGGGTLPKHVPGLPNSPSPNADLDTLRASGDVKGSGPSGDHLSVPHKDAAGGHLADAAGAASASSDKPVVYGTNVHPSAVEPTAQGSVGSSHYAHEPDTNTLAASSSSSSLPTRKKSIGAKLEEAWHDVKAKAAQLFEKKPKEPKEEPKTTTETTATTAAAPVETPPAETATAPAETTSAAPASAATSSTETNPAQ